MHATSLQVDMAKNNLFSCSVEDFIQNHITTDDLDKISSTLNESYSSEENNRGDECLPESKDTSKQDSTFVDSVNFGHEKESLMTEVSIRYIN